MSPSIRTDLVDAYVFRRAGGSIELLQLRRVDRPPETAWQPIMGHVEAGESGVETLWRELREEVGLSPDDAAFVGAWALQGIHPYFLASRDAIMLSPRFAVEVRSGWAPTLNHEHNAWRWTPLAEAERAFGWPGQHGAIAELAAITRRNAPPALDQLRLVPPATGQ